LPGGGFKASDPTINAWVIARQRMSGLAGLADVHRPASKGQSVVAENSPPQQGFTPIRGTAAGQL
jgi:hypothetical protein